MADSNFVTMTDLLIYATMLLPDYQYRTTECD